MTYRWVLKCGDTKRPCYVSDIDPDDGLFAEYSSQRTAKMFMTKQDAVDALKRRSAHPHWNNPAHPLRRPPYQVRVVRLKLKEKAWACRWVLKCGDTKRPCYVSDIDPDDGLFAEYSSQRTAKMFMTKQDAVDALKRRSAHPHWNNPAHPLRRPPYQVRVVRLKLKEKA